MKHREAALAESKHLSRRRPRTRRFVLPALLLVANAPPLSAQGPRHFPRAVDEPLHASAISIPVPRDTTEGITGGAVLGASLGLLIGVAGGAVAGAAMEGGSCSDQCGLAGAVAGAAIGPTLGVPLGLHFGGANRRVGRSLAISALVGTAGLAVLDWEDPTAVILLVPATRLLIALLAKQ
jgi:hypothetical protein